MKVCKNKLTGVIHRDEQRINIEAIIVNLFLGINLINIKNYQTLVVISFCYKRSVLVALQEIRWKYLFLDFVLSVSLWLNPVNTFLQTFIV